MPSNASSTPDDYDYVLFSFRIAYSIHQPQTRSSLAFFFSICEVYYDHLPTTRPQTTRRERDMLREHERVVAVEHDVRDLRSTLSTILSSIWIA